MISSVRNAIRILNCFTHEEIELSLTEISTKLGMNKSTIHHLVKTLRQEGVLEKKQNNLYALGNKLFEWGSLVGTRNQLVPLSIPHIHELVNQTGEIVHLGVLQSNQVLYVAKSEMPSSININTVIGSRRPAYCTALGKMLLADDREILMETLDSREFASRTRRTITDKTRLLEELKKASEIGLAADEGEFSDGIHCIAARITDAEDRCIAAISVCGPEQRMLRNRSGYVRFLTNSARAISKAVNDSSFNDLKQRKSNP